MKNIKIITCTIAFLPSVAIAEKYATIINIKPNYSNITNYINEEFCINKERPIYDRSYYENTNGGDILTGMIIGGLLGKGATGKDKGAAAGAVLGGIIAGSPRKTKSRIIGYEPVKNCKVRKVPKTIRHIKNYTINYKWRGIIGSSYTHNHYSIGEQIPISININAK